jgi:FtsP/CotA-like multicopper oxidase with cupredoxin domain
MCVLHSFDYFIACSQQNSFPFLYSHVHGTAAHAYMSSLFGFIIVEGTDADITSAPGIDGATEVLMLMSEFWPNGSGLAPPFLPIAYATNWLSVVNGHLAAETNYQVEQGETLLFRVVSATVEPTIRIVAPGITFIVLADDGQPLPEPVATDTVVVEAGGRKDFIVRFDTPGEYNFTRLPWGTAFAPDEEACLANFGPPPMESIPVHPCISYDIEAPLATVVVTESNASAIARVEDSSLIDSIQLPEISDRYKALMNQEHVAEKTVTFDQAVGFPLFDIPYDGPFVPPGVGFGINSHFFVPGAIEDNVTEGTCELWHVVSNPAGMEHTFHAHGCKFVVLSYDGEPNESPTWVDTEMIPGANMTIHICFDRLQAGDEFPVHCHAPSHQDIGMMAMYSVVAAGDEEGDGDEEGETSGALDRTPVTVLLTFLVGCCLLAFPLL